MTVSGIIRSFVMDSVRHEDDAETAQLREATRRLFHERHAELTDDQKQILEEISDQLDEGDRAKSSRLCPECSRRFVLVTANQEELDCCQRCKSIWLDTGELQHLSGLIDEIPGRALKSRASKRCCPICKQAMVEYQFARGTNLMVDACPNDHGVYLQQGELKRILQIEE